MEHTHEKALEKFVYSIEYPIKIVIKSIVVARKPRERWEVDISRLYYIYLIGTNKKWKAFQSDFGRD
jgi:hypothetical protein